MTVFYTVEYPHALVDRSNNFKASLMIGRRDGKAIG